MDRRPAFLFIFVIVSLVSLIAKSQNSNKVTVDFVKNLPGEIKFVAIQNDCEKESQVAIEMRCSNELKPLEATFNIGFTMGSFPDTTEFTDSLGSLNADQATLKSFYCNPQYSHSLSNYINVWAQNVKISDPIACSQNDSRYHPLNKGMMTEWFYLEAIKDKRIPRSCMEEWQKESHREIVLVPPAESDYLLVFRVENINGINGQVQFNVRWLAPNRPLNLKTPPNVVLLPFFEFLCGVYVIFAASWLIVCVKHRRLFLPIHVWISSVLVICILESAVSVAKYWVPDRPEPNRIDQLLIIVSCLSGTAIRMLILTVSTGLGVIKQRLGSTAYKILGFGFLYFLGRLIPAIAPYSIQVRIAIITTELFFLLLMFCTLFFILISLQGSKNAIKLNLYRKFIRSLLLGVLVCFVVAIWLGQGQNPTNYLEDCKKLLAERGTWQILAAEILVVIMILWRPDNLDRFQKATLESNTGAYHPIISEDNVLPSENEETMTKDKASVPDE